MGVARDLHRRCIYYYYCLVFTNQFSLGLLSLNYVRFLSNFVFLNLSYKNGSMVRQEIRDKYANGDWKVL